MKIPGPYHFTETDPEHSLSAVYRNFTGIKEKVCFYGTAVPRYLGNRHPPVDVVVNHRILKCFVLTDRKEEAGYEDIRQVNMYLGYIENEENTEGANPPVGMGLLKEKRRAVVPCAPHHISLQLCVQMYRLYLPDKEELQEVITGEVAREPP